MARPYRDRDPAASFIASYHGRRAASSSGSATTKVVPRKHPGRSRRRVPAYGVVYFIKNSASDAIKIGTTIDLRGRLRKLQSSSPERLAVIGVMRGDRGDEQRIHSEFSHLRMVGEWFRSTPELLAYIIANARSQ